MKWTKLEIIRNGVVVLFFTCMMIGCREQETSELPGDLSPVEQIYDVDRKNTKQPDGESEKVGNDDQGECASSGNNPGT